MTGKIRVLIVDDISESRDNVAKLLRFEPDIEVVGMAGSGEEAVELAAQLEPHIVLMDVNMPGMDGITATTRITSRQPNTAVIMMSIQNEADFLRRSMMAGAREFLAKPFSLDELIESIRHVNQLASQTRRVVSEVHVIQAGSGPQRNRKAKIISTFSLKGGIGRTTLASNLAVAIRNQHPDKEVAIIDGNLLHGDQAVVLNATEQKSIADIVRNFHNLDQDLISDILITHSSGVKLLAAPPDAQSGEQVTGDHMRQILQYMTAMFDFIVIDTRPSFDEITLTLLDHSDKILLILSLELTAIKGAKQYLELSDLLGYDSDRISLVINRSTLQAGIPIEDVGASLKGEIIARLPDDPLPVSRSVNEGVPIVQSAPASALSQEFNRLAATLTRGADMIGEADEPELAVAGSGQRGLARWMKKKSS
ncbi:MAG: response regulator [Chloroflexota bacterium]|nr:response regulator [Chloroflexota bacterium]